MILERSLQDARVAGIRLLTACLWGSTLSLAPIGWMLKSQDVWLALALTVLVSVIPTWCAWKGRNDGAARISFGIAAALHPAIYVFLFRGHVWQMDMHMYFFAALASLTVLYDRRPLLVAAAIIVVHHLMLQATTPSLAFAGKAEIGRVLLHATLVILQTVVLSMLATRLAKMIHAFEASRLRNEEFVRAAAASEDLARAALAVRDVDYRLLAEHSSDMIVRIGLDGIRRYVSPACQQLLGYSTGELLGGAPIAAIHVEDRTRVAEVCRSLLTGATNPICTYRQQHRDGSYVWLEAVYRLVRSEEGEPIEFVASVRDISRRRAVELEATGASARLQENNRLFAMASALAKVGHWHLDLAHNKTSWSDEVCRIHGVPEGYSPPLETAIEAYHPDDRERVSAIIADAIETCGNFEFSATLLLADGNTKRVTAQGQAECAPDGKAIGLFGVFQDISAQTAAQDALLRSEQQYRLLADNATDVVLRTGDDGFVTYASPSCVDLSGYVPEKLVGRHCGEFIHPEDLAIVHDAHVALITGQAVTRIVEYRLRHSAGEWRWLESHMKPWRTPECEGGGVISAIRDIGARKKLEGDLVEARDRAENAARAKAGFLANMSHEIRTPMNGVLGFAELVLSGELPPNQRKHVELIAESGRSMMRLLNDILDVSKIDSGKMQVTEEPVDLRHIVRRCADLMKAVVDTKNIVLSTRVEPAVPALIVGDPLRLRQIMLNLIGNAVKFTERGAVTVEVSVENDGLRIDVSDTGIGILPERLEMIFEQFAQADDTTARLYGGTGLGLTISGELASLMGGTIMVRSVVRQGTTFTVRLPLQIFDGQETLVVREAGLGAITGSAKGRPRVLIAEDHDINQELIMAMAHRAGMDPALAIDGADAIKMVERAAQSSEPFQLVLMDMQMPNMDGLEAARRLRALGYSAETLPIVAITANAYSEDIQACLGAGMQAHLAKPVRVRDLTAVLARFVSADAEARVTSSPVSPKLLDRYNACKTDTANAQPDDIQTCLDARILPHRVGTADDNPKRSDVDAMTQLKSDYAQRRKDLFDLLAEIDAKSGAMPTDFTAVLDQLHKLAGTAGFFDQAALGDAASSLEQILRKCPEQKRSAALRAGLERLRRAA